MKHYNIIFEIIIILFIILITIYALHLILSPNNRETITYYTNIKPISSYNHDTNVDVYYQLFNDNLETNTAVTVWPSACVLASIILIFVMWVNHLASVQQYISYYGCIYFIIFGILYVAFSWFSHIYMRQITTYNQELMKKIREKTKPI